MIRLLLIFLFIANGTVIMAQKQDHIWIFGDSTGLDFNTPVPTPLTGTNNYSIENGASISDTGGNLLFYCSASYGTDTTSIKNRLNQIMPSGNQIYGYASVTQGSIIVPFPSDSQKYYVFHFYAPVLGLGTHLYYSYVDMNLDSGYGDVAQKNILLNNTDYFTEKSQIVRHGNGRDWWLITHEGYSNNNKFITYLITPVSIQGPYYQNIGSTINSVDNIGQMKISPNGDKLVIIGSGGTFNILEFDRCSGTLSNNINLSLINPTSDLYGCSFSGNGDVLYVSKLDSLFQYDLTASNIAASKQLLLVKTLNCYFGQLQLAPDNKLYMATYCGGPLPNNIFTNENMNLTVINDPDVYGPGCNIAPYSFNLGGRRSFLGLPNMQNYNLGRWVGSPCDTLSVGISEIPEALSYSAYPNPNSGILYIKFNNLSQGSIKIVISNMLGEELMTFYHKNNSKETSIDMTGFNNGTYIYEMFKESVVIAREKLLIIK